MSDDTIPTTQDKQQQLRDNAAFMQSIPPALSHLIPSDLPASQLADWIAINHATLRSMSLRHIAIERGLIKPPTE